MSLLWISNFVSFYDFLLGFGTVPTVWYCLFYFSIALGFGWRVWRYQRGNKNLYIEEEQTTQWAKEKIQKDKQRSTKHTYKTKGRVTQLFRRHGIVCFFISLSLMFA